MIGKLVAPLLKLLLPKVTEKVTDHLAKIFKLDSVLRYVEMPNDADKKIKKLEARVEVMVSEFKELKEAIEGVERMLKKFGK
tara:strand:- start:35 stop:280 length:246 start_codon:yes stop_codon:yes gene_type:complete